VNTQGEMAVFVSVVEAGSFSAAARALRLTPSAVSKLIARLEERLGARLIQRTTRRLNLTHEGVAYYQRSLSILKEIEEIEQTIGQAHALPRGLLTVNAAVAFAEHQIVPYLREFLDLYPDVQVELTVTDQVIDLVQEGVDVAIRVNVRPDSLLVARLLAEDQRVICASPRYLEQYGTPKVPADLADHNCLTWKANQSRLNDWPFNGPDGLYKQTVSGSVEVNSGETLYDLVRHDVGIARLAELVVGNDIKAGRLVHLLEEYHQSDPLTVHAVYPHRRHLLGKVRAFVDFLVRKYSPQPPWRVTDQNGGEKTDVR